MYKVISASRGLILLCLVVLAGGATTLETTDITTSAASSEPAPTTSPAPITSSTQESVPTTITSATAAPTTTTVAPTTQPATTNPPLTTTPTIAATTGALNTTSASAQEQAVSTTSLPEQTEQTSTPVLPVTEAPSTTISIQTTTTATPSTESESLVVPSRVKLLSNEARSARLIDGIKSFVDLSLPLNDSTLHWPTNKGFQYESQVDGERKDSKGETYYLKSDGFRTAVHAGTHLDAPVHFSKDGWAVDEIPLERLVDVPACVIDVSTQVKFMNNTYEFVKSDFINPTTKESLVKPGSVVLVYTGMSQLYAKGEKAYLGTDTKDISEMRVPGFSREAAEYMVERGVYGVGLDSISADSSNNHGVNGTFNPVAHTILNKNNIYILENVNSRLAEMIDPNLHMHLVITPLPITKGSGSPVRLVAMTVHSDCPQANFASTAAFSPLIATAVALLYAIFAFLMM